MVACKVQTSGKLFYAADKLASLFNVKRITAILNCECYSCEDDRRNRSDVSAIEYVEYIANKAVSLFGLFVQTEHPQLIAKVLHNGWNDRELIGSLTRFDSTSANTEFNVEELQQKYWPELKDTNSSESIRVANDIHEHMFAFAIPSIESGDFQKYSEKTVLPFVKEVRMDNNSSSADVYSFEIYPGYRSETVRYGSRN
jgi:hypothetical protein